MPIRATDHLGFLGAVLMVLLGAAPAARGFAPDDQEKATSAPARVRRPNANAAPMVFGRVTNDSGDPLSGVRVRVALPATDMRFVFSGSGHKILEATTDEEGQYKLELPDVAKATTVSLDAMRPGYQTLVGTLMAGGEIREVEVARGTAAQASFELKRALYVKGIVVDENGGPIPNAKIYANASFAISTGGIQHTASAGDGSFEIFNYPVEPFADAKGKSKGLVHIQHPSYLPNQIDDVYALSLQKRETIRVVLATGRKVWGTVVDDKGRPVPNVMVEVSKDEGEGRKAVLTGPSGRFILRGLVDGSTNLRAHAMNLRQKIKLPITLDRDYNNLKLQLQPISLTNPPRVVDVLGMKLADVTPELQSVYDLWHKQGALILDPGKDSARLEIGELAEGYCFWMAGDRTIGGVRQFVEQILAETAGKDAGAEDVRCRIVYTYSTVDEVGTNTQYLKLTKDDLAELRKVLAQLTDK